MNLWDRSLIRLGVRPPPKFKVGDRVKDPDFSFYFQDGIICKVKSDLMYKHWGYKYDIDWTNSGGFQDYKYEKDLVLLESGFLPYDPKQQGDCDDDI